MCKNHVSSSPQTKPRRGWLPSFARRRGRTLTPHKKKLVKEFLPKCSVQISGQTVKIDGALWLDEVPASIVLEIGFGAGEHLAEQAKINPQTLFLGCEPYINGVATLLAHMQSKAISNIRIWPDDARELLKCMPKESVDKICILHPDPWPKIRHHKRRLVNAALLSMLSDVLKPDGELLIATDHRDYANWIIEHVIDHPKFSWNVTGSKDWLTPPENWKQTRYAIKAAKKGDQCIFIRSFKSSE